MKLTAEQKKSIANYKRMGIYIAVLSGGKVKISQNSLINGYILNQKQLVERAREIFPDEKIIPVVFSLDIEHITVDWILNKMDQYGIKRKDLIKQLALDKSYLSRLFGSGKHSVELSKPVKATFFYYFLTYELNQDLREQIS